MWKIEWNPLWNKNVFKKKPQTQNIPKPPALLRYNIAILTELFLNIFEET